MQPFPSRPVVTLTTDFGLADHYAGTMKGVLLSHAPGVFIVDISHDIAPFSIFSGAYTIDQAAPYFPSGTIHVIVVDPGVGTSRKPILLEALGQFFIAPDNGVLSLVFTRQKSAKAYEITNRSLWLTSPSSTFHGRDIFAPVAAALASGAARPDEVGPALANIELLRDLEARAIKPRLWKGKLLSIDRFGNSITNFRASRFAEIARRPFTMRCGRRRITRFQTTFGEAPKGVCFAYFGSSGYIELGMNQRSAAAFLGAAPGDSISLQL